MCLRISDQGKQLRRVGSPNRLDSSRVVYPLLRLADSASLRALRPSFADHFLQVLIDSSEEVWSKPSSTWSDTGRTPGLSRYKPDAGLTPPDFPKLPDPLTTLKQMLQQTVIHTLTASDPYGQYVKDCTELVFENRDWCLLKIAAQHLFQAFPQHWIAYS
ncbi:hypothetical protein RRG08_061595 [Elysia crispata]|uniref:Uncharacterized protein n=1 Tax=Elysia crispata TaxID=231223 RepID=A0AAE0YTA4_9GAST|nr:hypothetical protein RRG08_061595 [Elysia crispata]